MGGSYKKLGEVGGVPFHTLYTTDTGSERIVLGRPRIVTEKEMGEILTPIQDKQRAGDAYIDFRATPVKYMRLVEGERKRVTPITLRVEKAGVIKKYANDVEYWDMLSEIALAVANKKNRDISVREETKGIEHIVRKLGKKLHSVRGEDLDGEIYRVYDLSRPKEVKGNSEDKSAAA